MIHDRIENFELYNFGDTWKEAFDFIREANVDSDEKRYELSNGIFVSIESYPTKPHERAIFESHEKHVDIQWTIDGAESIAYTSVNELEVKKPYNEKADVTFYDHPEVIGSQVNNLKGYFTVLFPEDAHMPQLQSTGYERVKKGVVKIPTSLIQRKNYD